MTSRRKFLQGLSAAGVSLGLNGLSSSAQGGTKVAPKRLILISHCHGWTYDSWKMRPKGLSEKGSWEVNFKDMAQEDMSECLAPLHRHRNRMLALDGLSLGTSELDIDGYRHQTGWIHAWTGNWAHFTGTEIGAQSASLDQIVAAEIARTDRLPSIEMTINSSLEEGRPFVFPGTGLAMPMIDSPAALWERLYGPSQSSDPLWSKQKDVLDFAHHEYATLLPHMKNPIDREKLEQHYALVQSLAQRVDGMAELECGSVPSIPKTLSEYNDTFDGFAEMIAGAFSCDITRVASLSLGEMPTYTFGWDHVTDDTHKGLAHEIYNDPDAHQAMTDYYKVHAEQVAHLVDVLESTMDVDGNPLMDNTLIVWGSEMANGWHGYQHYCPVLIGGGWHFKTGRYLYWPHETPIEVLVPASIYEAGYAPVSGMPHQRMLVSVAQAMGLDIDQVGLGLIQSQTGAWVDCSGNLPNLT